MSLRCGCPNEADEIVFGTVHECTKDPYEHPYERILDADDLDPGEG